MDINFAGPPGHAGEHQRRLRPCQIEAFCRRREGPAQSLKEIKKVDIIGALEREIQINVDMMKMQANGLTMGDIACRSNGRT